MRDRRKGISMNPTLKLLRVIGSPFVADQELPKNRDEALELYDYATKNKIGLLYLTSLEDQEKLEEFGLKLEYQEKCEKHSKQAITANRFSILLNSFNINYAVFKSIMPFPATLSDVDVLFFGSNEEYKKAVKMLVENRYIKSELGSGPHVDMFHDMRDCDHIDLREHEKDVYDIDLYKDVAISHVVYLDKRKLTKHVIEKNISDGQIKILRPEAELVVSITHSIIPEQLCTLLIYYATLYYFEKMSTGEIKRFINIAKENNVTFPIRAHCSLVVELHQAAYGFVPEKIKEVLTNLGDARNNLLKNNFKMPHRYSWSTIIGTLLEMTKGEEFRKSVVVQIMHMLSPKFAKYVLGQIIWRRRRETY